MKLFRKNHRRVINNKTEMLFCLGRRANRSEHIHIDLVAFFIQLFRIFSPCLILSLYFAIFSSVDKIIQKSGEVWKPLHSTCQIIPHSIDLCHITRPFLLLVDNPPLSGPIILKKRVQGWESPSMEHALLSMDGSREDSVSGVEQTQY